MCLSAHVRGGGAPTMNRGVPIWMGVIVQSGLDGDTTLPREETAEEYLIHAGGMPLAFTQKDFLVCGFRSNRSLFIVCIMNICWYFLS